MKDQPIETEPAEIYGGPLDGTHLSVNKDKDHFEVGVRLTTAVIDGSGVPIWAPGPNNLQVYSRTGRRTKDGKAVFDAFARA